MKYRPGTIDNMAVLRRNAQRTARRVGAALTSEGTRPFQSVEKLTQTQGDLQALVGAALNVTVAGDQSTGIGITKADTWITICSTTVRVPDGRSMGSFQSTGSSAFTVVRDIPQGGAYRLRLTVNHLQVAVADAARGSVESDVWEALVSGVLNLSNLTPGVAVPVVLQARASDATDWPVATVNAAELTVQAAFPHTAEDAATTLTVAATDTREVR